MNVWICCIGHEEGHSTPIAFFDHQRAIDWVHEKKKKLQEMNDIKQKYDHIKDVGDKFDLVEEEKQKFCDENDLGDTLNKYAWYELIDVQ